MNMLKYNRVNSLIKRTMKPITFLLALIVLTGCNEEFPNLLKEKYPADFGGGSAQNSKVLFVIVDGLQGSIVEEFEPEEIPTISEMNKNGLYSFNSLVDFGTDQMTEALGWTTLLTGVTSTKHGVVTAGDFASGNIDEYPSFISRIKAVKPEIRSAVFSGSTDFVDYLAKDADEKKVFTSDEETKAATVTELGSQQADVVVAQFHNINDAANGSLTAYKDAIKQFDGYLEELKTALEARPDYKDESWLVVVTSSKGRIDGTANSSTAFDDASRNSFTLMYNPNFSSNQIPRPLKLPYAGNTIKFARTSATAHVMAVMTDGSKYDIGSPTQNHTLQFKYKKSGNSSYPVIISKQEAPETNGTGTGWNVHLNGGRWDFFLKGNNKIMGGEGVNDGEWHTISIVFNNDDAKVYLYTDGVNTNSLTIRDNYSTTAPLRIGLPETGARLNYNITDIQIYNVALSHAEVAASACKVDIKTSDPLFNKLSGYWPATDGVGNKLKNRIVNGGDFDLQGDYSWEGFNDLSNNVCVPMDEKAYVLVPNAKDLTFQIYQWLGISTPQNWGLDGRAWTPSYTQIRP